MFEGWSTTTLVENAGKNLLQPIDDDVRTEARRLIRSARYGALSVLRPSDGFPAISRVSCATDFNGQPVLLISGLSLHAKALHDDRRCSLLVGEPGKGDPLAHPRLSLFATARIVEPQSDERQNLRRRFLARHPKAELYVDFPDFRFAILEPKEVSLNGGFAKAYELTATDVIDAPVHGLEAASIRAIDHMNEDHSDAIDQIAALHGHMGSGWRIVTADRWGFEISRSDALKRIAFRSDAAEDGGYRKAFVDMIRD